ncbi:hypothetical protein RIF29_15829 [Crotalaria pallida]|uniref:Uncharacterized protein n=1 Tax=Crotalaria pallida TaxID=3830 RepID=A0AAN9ICY3_CROPI
MTILVEMVKNKKDAQFNLKQHILHPYNGNYGLVHSRVRIETSIVLFKYDNVCFDVICFVLYFTEPPYDSEQFIKWSLPLALVHY